MSTDPRGCRRAGRWCRVVGLGLLFALGPGGTPAAAQIRVTPNTEVRSIRFEGVHSLSERSLKGILQTRGRGSAHGLRTLLGKLPLIDPPLRHPFSPRTLQEDVVRLRGRYQASGFAGTEVRYRVEPMEKEDLLDIVFVIEEGTAQQVVEVAIVPGDSLSVLPVPESEARSWANLQRRVAGLRGRRFDLAESVEQRDRIRSWWRNRGFAWAEVTGGTERDTLRNEVRVRFDVDPGPRVRFGEIAIEGSRTVSRATVEREVPFRPGDYYSKGGVEQGRRDLQQLEIIRTARIDVSALDAAVPPADFTGPVPVSVRITEAKPRVVEGQIGYGIDAGASTEASWRHRNLTGGARVFRVTALAQTGKFAITGEPDVRYRGAVSLLQPHFLARRMEGVVSPFIEYREDTQDRSLQIGSNFTLVYELARQASVSLDYQIASRRIYEYRYGELSAGNIDLLTLLTQIAQGQIDSLGTRLGTSLITLSGLVGNLDDLSNPRSGFLLRPALQATAPTAWSEITYWKADGSVYGFAPVSRRTVLAARVTAGRMFPFGKSVPGPDENPLWKSLQLRDASFTAGGSSDVRGWGNRFLGPKYPDVRFREQGDSLAVYSEGYVPLGGFSRISFSLELRLPMLGLGPNFGSHLFLDGGRVWTDDARFGAGEVPLDQDRFFYAAGAGMDIHTPVGAIKLSLGYKLNPSLTDLVDADDLLRALLDGTPTDDLERHDLRRLQLNLALGASY